MNDEQPILTSELDMEILVNFHGPNGEMEARAVESVLRAAGIEAVVEGAIGFSSMPFEVSVARNQVEDANAVLAAALEAGAAGAEEAEDASEKD